MEAPLHYLAFQLVSDPIATQRIEGTVRLRIWGQSLDPEHPATWALSIRVVSREGDQERGVLLPITTGGRSEFLGPDLRPLTIGPLTLTPVDAHNGDRLVVELGSSGEARVESREGRQTWIEFSADILFEDLRTHFNEARSSRKIGRCIYCGSTDRPLSDEHIIPKGLNGELTLTRASCARCRKVTSKFETEVLRNAFGPMRVALQMRSRRPNERPSHLPLQLRRDGKEMEIQIPVQKYPAILTLPIFPEPACVTERSYSSGISLVNVAITQVSGLPLAELYRRYGGEYVGIRVLQDPVAFARFVAKIAYGFAVLRFGPDHMADRYVLPAILGEVNDIGRWVGCDSGLPVDSAMGLHSLTLRMEAREIHVMVRLFAQFAAPEYHVVVGRLR